MQMNIDESWAVVLAEAMTSKWDDADFSKANIRWLT